jgi:large subunit ribosomal protein L32e
MTETKKLLETRKRIKSKKPEFLQQDYHKKKRVSRKWKRPTGLQSKMRHQFKGYARRVKQGWRSPIEIRGYHGKGLKPVTVYAVKDLEKVGKGEGVIIAKTVGLKKRLDIVNKVAELKLTLLNIKPESVKAKIEQNKQLKEKKQKDKQDKKKTLEEAVKKQDKKKEDKKKEEAVEQTVEEKKDEEKKLKDDVLIHSQ